MTLTNLLWLVGGLLLLWLPLWFMFTEVWKWGKRGGRRRRTGER